jgi:adenylosuccinate synthase
MNKTVTVVVGGQFGSEAKGKVISYLAIEFDVAVRTGSPNAGHTVFDDEKGEYRLQQVPATFLNQECLLCIGAGALINPDVLRREVEKTQTKNRLYIDPQAGIIENKHIEMEGELIKSIGSTGKGCGAALVDRLWRKDFKLARDVLKDEFSVCDVSGIINKMIDENKTVLVEGTQGFGLSLYHGTYPYTTSRDTTAMGFLAEAGISPMCVKDIILVIRTYPIRVAGTSGPFPNEISWEGLSEKVGKVIIEKTTVTQKVRRVAEFDIGIVKKAIEINRPTQIALQFLNYLFPKDENKNKWDDLSIEAKEYIENLETDLKTPITLIGTGQFNEAMIDKR